MKTEEFDDLFDGQLQTILEKKFHELNEGRAPAPADLKEEVFATLNSLILVGDLMDLFTVKFAQTEMNIVDPSIPSQWDAESEEEGEKKVKD
jgi:hypothetical protein